MSALDPGAMEHRPGLEGIFDLLDAIAEARQDDLLVVTTAALRRVHGLYPGADERRLRGTGHQQARVEIHNAIVEVFDEYLTILEAGPGLPGSGTCAA